MGLAMETLIVPGISRKLRRGKQRPDVTAIGTMLAPVSTARRLAPVL